VVVFLDADDYLMPEALELAVPLLLDPDVTKVHWPLKVVDEHGVARGPLMPAEELPDGDFRERVRKTGPTQLLSAPGCGNAWARWYLDELFPIPEDIYPNGGDTYLFEAAPFFGRVRALSTPLTCYRQHAANDHTQFTVDDKVARELRFWEHYAPLLAQRSRVEGFEPDLDGWRRSSWWHRHRALNEAVERLAPPGSVITVIDDDTLEVGPIRGHERLPFGYTDTYCGAPESDDDAIRITEHTRSRGVTTLVVGWMSFWWLDHYPRWRDYLYRQCDVLSEDEVAILFDLQV
jgi:hypothetical protein